MTLYELLEITNDTYDTYDTVFDAVVTVDWIEEEKDFYDRFCRGIIKFVTVVKKSGDGLICEWSDFITRNLAIFKKFAKEYWYIQYEDDEDEFIYQWITELHNWMGGYVSEDIYKIFVEEYMTQLK